VGKEQDPVGGGYRRSPIRSTQKKSKNQSIDAVVFTARNIQLHTSLQNIAQFILSTIERGVQHCTHSQVADLQICCKKLEQLIHQEKTELSSDLQRYIAHLIDDLQKIELQLESHDVDELLKTEVRLRWAATALMRELRSSS